MYKYIYVSINKNIHCYERSPSTVVLRFALPLSIELWWSCCCYFLLNWSVFA